MVGVYDYFGVDSLVGDVVYFDCFVGVGIDGDDFIGGDCIC